MSCGDATRRPTLSAPTTVMALHVRSMLEMQRRGAVVFDYGNNLREGARKAGLADAFGYPGFVPAFIRPLFCEGQGPFRWVALSGDPGDILRTDRVIIEEFRLSREPGPLDQSSPRSGFRSRVYPPASAGLVTASGHAPG